MFVWLSWTTVPCLQVLIQGKANVPHLGRALTDVQELKQATCPKVQRSKGPTCLTFLFPTFKQWILVQIRVSIVELSTTFLIHSTLNHLFDSLVHWRSVEGCPLCVKLWPSPNPRLWPRPCLWIFTAMTVGHAWQSSRTANGRRLLSGDLRKPCHAAGFVSKHVQIILFSEAYMDQRIGIDKLEHRSYLSNTATRLYFQSFTFPPWCFRKLLPKNECYVPRWSSTRSRSLCSSTWLRQCTKLAEGGTWNFPSSRTFRPPFRGWRRPSQTQLASNIKFVSGGVITW